MLNVDAGGGDGKRRSREIALLFDLGDEDDRGQRLLDAGRKGVVAWMLGLVGVPPNAEDALAINIADMITYGQRMVGIMEGDSDPQTFIPELIAAQQRGDCVKVVLIP